MICDWLAIWEYLFPEESSRKINFFMVWRERRSDILTTEGERIKKELTKITIKYHDHNQVQWPQLLLVGQH